MNIAVINAKDLFKYILKFFCVAIIIWLLISVIKTIKFSNQKEEIEKKIEEGTEKISKSSLTKCLDITLPIISYTKTNENEEEKLKLTDILAFESVLLDSKIFKNTNLVINEEELTVDDVEEAIHEIALLPAEVTTQEVNENNIKPKVTNTYGTVKIDNQSDYEITEDMLVPDAKILNKKDIAIYHTHTCESYTSSEGYEYEMTGNYRTTDLNYSVVRVGTELTSYLEKKGFNVDHNTTYHDYPAYSGSYSRSLETVQNMLLDKDTQIVIDLHRDAVRKQ